MLRVIVFIVSRPATLFGAPTALLAGGWGRRKIWRYPSMRITVNDPRTLAVAIARPDVSLWLNWSTGAWETPFAPANHAKPLIAMADPIAPTVKTVDIGPALLARPDVAAVLFAVDSGTTPPTYTAADIWTLPARIDPAFGGFTAT